MDPPRTRDEEGSGLEIRVDDPRRDPPSRLLREHLDDMAVKTPPESIHALDVDALCTPEITFWTAWEGEELLGCGALRELDPSHGEIKSMRTARDHRLKGVASRILEHILDEARGRSYRRLSLETGATEAFAPAHALYSRFGFEFCGPFADYAPDAHSVFMTRIL